jgi:site-specific DNA-methyltransferase (adenine-specific)
MLQWVVKTYTNEGELIADPCAGSGSMGVAALGVRREFVGWDFEPRPPSAVDVGLFG